MKADRTTRELAKKEVESIRKNSVLRELWADAGELDEWCKVVDGLLGRLSSLT
jgi:hypothetical protein